MTPSRPDPVRVLIVDDQRMFADALAALLELDDRVEVVGVADDATAAVDLALEQHVDVAVVDYVMPALDGLALTSRLRSLCPGLAVVLVSGRPETELEQQARDAGAAAFLRKGALGTEVADVVVDVADPHP